MARSSARLPQQPETHRLKAPLSPAALPPLGLYRRSSCVRPFRCQARLPPAPIETAPAHSVLVGPMPRAPGQRGRDRSSPFRRSPPGRPSRLGWWWFGIVNKRLSCFAGSPPSGTVHLEGQSPKACHPPRKGAGRELATARPSLLPPALPSLLRNGTQSAPGWRCASGWSRSTRHASWVAVRCPVVRT